MHTQTQVTSGQHLSLFEHAWPAKKSCYLWITYTHIVKSKVHTGKDIS